MARTSRVIALSNLNCITCGTPIYGPAIQKYCAACSRLAKKASHDKYVQANIEKVRAGKREYARKRYKAIKEARAAAAAAAVALA